MGKYILRGIAATNRAANVAPPPVPVAALHVPAAPSPSPAIRSQRQWLRTQPRSGSLMLAKEMMELQRKNAVLAKQREEAMHAHAQAVAEYDAEDFYWRKRFRTIKATHNKWLKEIKSTENPHPLSILADAAELDDQLSSLAES